MCEHGFLPIARENSKYPKGTPFVPNFLYLNTTNFHLMANVGQMTLATFSPILTLNKANFRLEYLIHSKSELNM